MDFIFYKIYAYYKKKDDVPVSTAILFVFLIQFFVLLFIGISINLFTNNNISEKYIEKEKFILMYGIVLGILFILNLVRYARRRNIESIVQRFEQSKLNKKIKTWMVFMIPMVSILLTVLMVIIVKLLR